MLTLNGKVINIYQTPKREKDGKEFEAQDKVQILGDLPQQNGQIKVDIVTLTTHDVSVFKDLVGKQVSVPVGVFATGKSLITFIPKGALPLLV
jgi:DNA replication initiation complex subunit (GINS family)